MLKAGTVRADAAVAFRMVNSAFETTRIEEI
jgi:hypothetical protein